MNPKIQSLISEAVNLYRNGLSGDAEATLQQVLKLQKNNLPALEILGLIKAASGSHLEATKYLKRAVQINPNNPSTQYNLAKALIDSGDYNASLPHHEKATKLAPHNVDAWINFGKTLSLQGRHNDALFAFDKALAIEPNQNEIRLNRGIALRALGLGEEALKEFNSLLELSPSHYLALVNKGITLIQAKEYNEGISFLDQALEINPIDITPILSKGQALYEQKMFKEAFSLLMHAENIFPNSSEVCLNIGSIQNQLKNYAEAIHYFDKAIALKPSYSEAFANRGLAHSELKLYEESLKDYNTAYALNPDIEFLQGSRLRVKMLLGDWNNQQNEVMSLVKKLSSGKKVISPFTLMSVVDSPELHLKAAKIWSEVTSYIRELSPINMEIKRDANKIKVAYFSSDFKNHPVSHLTAELFELHDRSKFEIYAISLEDGASNDPIRERLINAFDHFINVKNQTEMEIAELCRKLEIDIAIDLGGYTESARPEIFRYRAAPIQVNYLGYPGSLGTSTFEYIIADNIVIPESAREFYTEKIAYLPDSYMVDDSCRLPSEIAFSRSDFGLPEAAFVYCCFNNAYKFNPQIIQCWSNILNKTDNSVLWLSENNPIFRINLLVEFEAHGIDSSRIIFAKRMELVSDHLARHKLADLFLDTSPFNAHTTAVDSLKSGLPVLTMLGNSFPARVAGSLLNALNLPELITHNFEEYTDLAIALRINAMAMSEIRQKLISNLKTASLFNTKLFTSNLESLFTEMHKRHIQKEPPKHIYLNN